MSTATLPRQPKMPMVAPDVPVERITVAQYDAMIAAGVLTEDDPIELLDGFLVKKMPKGDDHESAIEILNDLLYEVIPRSVIRRCQGSLVLANSEPEPDFLLCTPSLERQGKHPRAKDTFLVIEVADSSLTRDRGLKLRIYASAGIPVYWIVNTLTRQVEVYTNPQPTMKKYSTRNDYKNGSEVPVVIRKATIGTIPVSAIFPYARKKT